MIADHHPAVRYLFICIVYVLLVMYNYTKCCLYFFIVVFSFIVISGLFFVAVFSEYYFSIEQRANEHKT